MYSNNTFQRSPSKTQQLKNIHEIWFLCSFYAAFILTPQITRNRRATSSIKACEVHKRNIVKSPLKSSRKVLQAILTTCTCQLSLVSSNKYPFSTNFSSTRTRVMSRQQIAGELFILYVANNFTIGNLCPVSNRPTMDLIFKISLY